MYRNEHVLLSVPFLKYKNDHYFTHCEVYTHLLLNGNIITYVGFNRFVPGHTFSFNGRAFILSVSHLLLPSFFLSCFFFSLVSCCLFVNVLFFLSKHTCFFRLFVSDILFSFVCSFEVGQKFSRSPWEPIRQYSVPALHRPIRSRPVTHFGALIHSVRSQS